MTQVTKVTDHYIIHMDDIDGVASTHCATLIIVICCNSCNQHFIDFVFARSAYNARITTHTLDIVMAWMIMANCNNRGVDFTQRGGGFL